MLEPGAAKEQVAKAAADLLEWSQREPSAAREFIREEIAEQLGRSGVASQAELDALRKRVRDLERPRMRAEDDQDVREVEARASQKTSTSKPVAAKTIAPRSGRAPTDGGDPHVASTRSSSAGACGPTRGGAGGRSGGVVLVAGTAATKHRASWSPTTRRSCWSARRRRYVSRGGDKLAAALDRFAIDPAGVDCLDAGASTGGFTDCLLRARRRPT